MTIETLSRPAKELLWLDDEGPHHWSCEICYPSGTRTVTYCGIILNDGQGTDCPRDCGHGDCQECLEVASFGICQNGHPTVFE